MKLLKDKIIIILLIGLITFFTPMLKTTAKISCSTNPSSSCKSNACVMYPDNYSNFQTYEYFSFNSSGQTVKRKFKDLGIYNVNGSQVYCVEPATRFGDGYSISNNKKSLSEYSDSDYDIDNTKKNLIKRILTFSTKLSKPTSCTKDNDILKSLAAQALIWEVVSGERTEATFKPSYNANKSENEKYAPNMWKDKTNKNFFNFIYSNSSTDKNLKVIYEEYKLIIDKIRKTFYMGNVGDSNATFSSSILSFLNPFFASKLKYNSSNDEYILQITSSDLKYWQLKEKDEKLNVEISSDGTTWTITSKEEVTLGKITISINEDLMGTKNNDGVPTVYTNGELQDLIEIKTTNAEKSLYVETENSYYGFTIKKVDMENDNSLSGARFIICKTETDCKNNKSITSAYTGIFGTKIVQLEEKGTYYIKETEAPDGYEINNEIYSVTLTDENYRDSNKEVRVTNKKIIVEEPELYHKVRIRKVDDNNKPLKGVEFRICYDNLCNKRIKTSTTNQDGYATFDNLSDEYSVYYVQEVKPLSGYKINDTVYTINVSENDTKDGEYAELDSPIVNKKQTYGFNLTKHTMDENGNVIKLDDACYSEEREQKSAVFTVSSKNGKLKFKEDENEKGKYVVSNDEDAKEEIKTCNGEFSVEGLNECEYTITETKSPTGVLPPNASKKVNVCGSDKNISFTNGFTGLEFQKKNENGKFISGGKFALEQKINGTWMNVQIQKKNTGVYTYSKDEGEYLFETNEGIAYISGLPVGEYRVVEKEAPADYELIEVADSPKITISDEYKDGYYILTMINHKVNKNGGDASAELVITITTGRKVLNYVLIVSSLAALLVIAIIIRKRIKK